MPVRGLSLLTRSIESYTSQKNVVTLSKFHDPMEVGEVIIKAYPSGAVVTVNDVAIVYDDFKEESVIPRINGKPTISFNILKNENADIIRTVDAVKAKIEEEQAMLPPDTVEFLFTADKSIEVRNKLQIVIPNGMIGLGKESVTQAEAQINIINNTLKNFQVMAPISGIIDAKQYNLGEVYQAGSVMYHVINIDQVYVEAEVPETYIKQIREKMKVTVVFDALGDRTFSGMVIRFSRQGQPTTATLRPKCWYQTQITLLNPACLRGWRWRLTKIEQSSMICWHILHLRSA